MKAITLLALLASTSQVFTVKALAADRVLTMLRIDLDLDGKPDLLRVVEGPRAGRPEIFDRRVEVRTAKGGRFAFTGLLRSVTYKDAQNSPCHTGVEENGEELQGGADVYVSLRRTGEASFVVAEDYDDNGCSYYGKREFQASLTEQGTFPLERAHRLVGHTGMGSGYYSKADFNFQYFHGEEELMDRAEGTGNEQHEWDIPRTCATTLAEIRGQQLPACAEYRK